MNFKTVFHILLILIGLDFIISIVGITMFNITEGNPLYYQLGLMDFFIVKMVASVFALGLLYYLKTINPDIGMCGLYILCGMYGAVFINNMYIIGCVIYG